MRIIDMFKMKAKGITNEEIEAENAKEIEYAKYVANRARLDALSKDIIQHIAGENVPDYSEKCEEFIRIHNEVRLYEGKQPRSIRN